MSLHGTPKTPKSGILNVSSKTRYLFRPPFSCTVRSALLHFSDEGTIFHSFLSSVNVFVRARPRDIHISQCAIDRPIVDSCFRITILWQTIKFLQITINH